MKSLQLIGLTPDVHAFELKAPRDVVLSSVFMTITDFLWTNAADAQISNKKVWIPFFITSDTNYGHYKHF